MLLSLWTGVDKKCLSWALKDVYNLTVENRKVELESNVMGSNKRNTSLGRGESTTWE